MGMIQLTQGKAGRYLGSFKTEEAAAERYDAAAKEKFGEYARINGR